MEHLQLIEAKSNKHVAGAALRTFFNIAEAWQLSNTEQMALLGGPAKSTFYNWKKYSATGDTVQLTHDTLERISYILGIYKALQMLLPSDEAADAWVKKPNNASIFGGQSALDRMLGGNVADLYVVRRYLDAERGFEA